MGGDICNGSLDKSAKLALSSLAYFLYLANPLIIRFLAIANVAPPIPPPPLRTLSSELFAISNAFFLFLSATAWFFASSSSSSSKSIENNPFCKNEKYKF